MTDKKRVLVVSEAHFLNSGFGTYAKELISRLHNTGKYDLAEFASYGRPIESPPLWKYYPNVPPETDDNLNKLYNQAPGNQFGMWRFDKVCLDFRPDIVICYRDPWMDSWIETSPSRPYFHWVWMPTVDSAPQKQEWVDTFANCDAVLTYSEFGGRVLKDQGKERINYIGCASPGINPHIYKPFDKQQVRKQLGIDPDCFIVGTVMRNQKRKLFFELMKAFKIFLNKAPKEIASKTFLYLHTSYPEKNGWDIADGVMENGLGGKVIMTYVCKNCKKFFGRHFQDALSQCIFCKQASGVCPTVGLGVSIEDLAQIYNSFDLYAQYAICEGFGMPQVEAASCGIPVAATDYSAMYDVVRFTQGYPVPVRKFFREIETNAERAYPDNDEMAKIMIDFFRLSDEDRQRKSMEVRKHTIARYDWDATAKVWEDYIDSYIPTGHQGKWDTEVSISAIPQEVPQNLSNSEFVTWLFSQVTQSPELIHSPEASRLIRDLNFGATIGQGVLEPVDREQLYKNKRSAKENQNHFNLIRMGRMEFQPDQFIIDAHQQHKDQNSKWASINK